MIYIFTIRFRHLYVLINIFQTHRAKLIKFLDLNSEFTHSNSRSCRREGLFVMWWWKVVFKNLCKCKRSNYFNVFEYVFKRIKDITDYRVNSKNLFKTHVVKNFWKFFNRIPKSNFTFFPPNSDDNIISVFYID